MRYDIKVACCRPHGIQMAEENSPSTSDSSPLHQTLAQNVEVAAQVQQASDDLSIVSTVLEQEIPDEIQVGDVAQAIAHTSELEKKLAQSAEKLTEVNEILSKEIKRRIEVTEQRDQSRALVEKLQSDVDDRQAQN
ncbi:hypothetical protein [Variovorax ginsengisoli]|uniref:Wyosine [tRNA(Phe)-imidazoG37] synthetase (Radical SAM superfamily) n=1 Tax=Variovorax ginsengisoli TaxID=363844 RepID=A0ABT9SBS9_9BURK|nr:hypothetical protein [Variovorax ginsengisoli]MDP9901811.1 wyosine [tRNA(Phe)-imidazoG37] synthetase (radical SAM superfamily) [Variovorax ginsengisoli]